MGQHDIRAVTDERSIRAFTRAMLQDLRALEMMLNNGVFNDRQIRIGVEQEMFLVDDTGRPSGVGPQIIEGLNGAPFVPELALFNMEVNLAPQPFDGGFLREMEQTLQGYIQRVVEAGQPYGAFPMLTGILPTLVQSDLTLDNMTPEDRYRQLNDALLKSRGALFSVFIRGSNELEISHDSIMLEAANTSLQLHLQVNPESFVSLYNLAQLLLGPLTAVAANSPLLLGRQLWHETRVALFERAVDSRSVSELKRGVSPRVTFGHDWVRESVLELFHENASRFRVLLTREPDPDPIAILNQGGIPELSSLLLHNGTVWRWNRPCYGVADGKPHLRIETRVLPSGPSVPDEVANAAFFFGMMAALPEVYDQISSRIAFADAKNNFLSAARRGLEAQFRWLDGQTLPARDLILNELLPHARAGLEKVSVPSSDIDRYLGIIEERVASGQNGARWMLDTLAVIESQTHGEAKLRVLATHMLEGQRSGEPVHRWPVPEVTNTRKFTATQQTVREVMAQDVFTVRLGDVVDLAASVMQWEHIRHVPVEDDEGKLVGLVTHRGLLKLLNHSPEERPEPVAVQDIMDPDPPTVRDTLPLLDAMRLLLESESGCLLVVAEGRLVGIATERDFLRAAAQLLQV